MSDDSVPRLSGRPQCRAGCARRSGIDEAINVTSPAIQHSPRALRTTRSTRRVRRRLSFSHCLMTRRFKDKFIRIPRWHAGDVFRKSKQMII